MRLQHKVKCAMGILNSRLTGKRFPLGIGWELTYSCNSNCAYCRTNKIKTKQLGKEQVFNIIDELKEMGCQLITYTGGECTLHPDFEDIVRYTSEKDISCHVVTNGRLVPEKSDTFKRYVDNVQLTLDGTKEVQEKQRSKGSYEATIRALKVLRGTKTKLN
ncbi:MAG: hypothetical protein DRO99_05420, partial [Candidatus Aenigmatarchaeota archaeon]